MKKYRIVVAGKDKDTPEQEFTLQSIFTHDGYNEETGENNIALVKLKVIVPVCKGGCTKYLLRWLEIVNNFL